MEIRRYQFPKPLAFVFARLGAAEVQHRAERILSCPAAAIWALWEAPVSWDDSMVSVRDVTAGPRGPGTVFEAKMRIAGRLTTTQREEIVDYEPFKRIRVRGGQWGVSYEHGFTIEPTADGRSRCICESRVAMQGPLRLAAPLIRRMERRGLEAKLDRLASHLAAERPRGSGAYGSA